MSKTSVVSFSGDCVNESKRRLRDLPDRVIDGDPHHVTKLYFESPDEKLVAGIWTSTPGKWRAFTDRDEYCYIVSGHVRLVDANGLAKTYKTGDGFLIPNGFDGFWEVIETTTKHFVIRHH